MTTPDLVGILGVAAILVSYAGLQMGWLRADDFAYSGLNILGPACLLYSLMYDFNLAAVITQITWMGLSGIGLMKAMSARRRKTPGITARCAENKT